MPFKVQPLCDKLRLVLSFSITTFQPFAQQTVTGKVIGSTDKQSSRETVQVKGEKGAAQTAADGTFSIRLAKSNGTLASTAVGFSGLTGTGQRE